MLHVIKTKDSHLQTVPPVSMFLWNFSADQLGVLFHNPEKYICPIWFQKYQVIHPSCESGDLWPFRRSQKYFVCCWKAWSWHKVQSSSPKVKSWAKFAIKIGHKLFKLAVIVRPLKCFCYAWHFLLLKYFEPEIYLVLNHKFFLPCCKVFKSNANKCLDIKSSILKRFVID